MNWLKGVVALSCIAVWTITVCVPLYLMGVLWLVLPIRLVRRGLAYPMDAMIDWWVGFNVMLVKCLGITRIDLTQPQATLRRDLWYLVVANHQSWADILILQNSLRHQLPVLKFFTKRELIWAPLIGPAMWFLGFPYVKRHSSHQAVDHEELHRHNVQVLAKSCKRFFDKPVAVLSFPEGTRVTEAKQQRTSSPYTYLLKPKAGGVRYVIDALRPITSGVVNITLDYDGEVPGFWDFLCGKCRQVRMDIELLDLPDGDGDDIERWMNSLWDRKDRQLESWGREAAVSGT